MIKFSRGFVGMRFKELVDTILSSPNGSITTKANTYYSNIHYIANRYSKVIKETPSPATDTKCILLKEQLIELVEALNTKKIRLKAVGSKK